MNEPAAFVHAPFHFWRAASDGSWIEADDPLYAAYFTEAQDAAKGDLIGPIKDDNGYHLLHLDDLAVCASVGVVSLLLLEALKKRWFHPAAAP